MKKDLQEKILNHLEEVKKILEVEEMKLEGKGDSTKEIETALDSVYELEENVNSVQITGAYQLILNFNNSNRIEVIKTNDVLTIRAYLRTATLMINKEDFADFNAVKEEIENIIHTYNLNIDNAMYDLMWDNGDIFYIHDNQYRKPLKELDFNKVLELILSGENYAL
jgi:hypothetical protein